MKKTCVPARLCRNALVIVFGVLAASYGPKARAGEPNELFLKHCAMCHGRDGKAESAIARQLGVKNLNQSKLTDVQIEQQIREGKLSDQKTATMPAFKDRLTAEEIKALIPVVKGFRAQPKQGPEAAR